MKAWIAIAAVFVQLGTMPVVAENPVVENPCEKLNLNQVGSLEPQELKSIENLVQSAKPQAVAEQDGRSGYKFNDLPFFHLRAKDLQKPEDVVVTLQAVTGGVSGDGLESSAHQRTKIFRVLSVQDQTDIGLLQLEVNFSINGKPDYIAKNAETWIRESYRKVLTKIACIKGIDIAE